MVGEVPSKAYPVMAFAVGMCGTAMVAEKTMTVAKPARLATGAVLTIQYTSGDASLRSRGRWRKIIHVVLDKRWNRQSPLRVARSKDRCRCPLKRRCYGGDSDAEGAHPSAMGAEWSVQLAAVPRMRLAKSGHRSRVASFFVFNFRTAGQGTLAPKTPSRLGTSIQSYNLHAWQKKGCAVGRLNRLVRLHGKRRAQKGTGRTGRARAEWSNFFLHLHM
uniref:Uncharacterized protein n=1 Tax=Trichuris muris TaxID=70415 RepID=A0A5S6QSX5_TRIMR